MKLFYSPGACSLASHIILEELGTPYEAVKADYSNGVPADLAKVSPLGVVPAIVTDQEQPLTEGSAILQYLADRKPESKLAPAPGTWERYQLMEWLNFIATEVHKNFTPFFAGDRMVADPGAQEQLRAYQTMMLGERFDIIARKLGSREYLMPGGFSIADAYLYTVLSWAAFVKVDLSRWPTLQAYIARVKARPATQRALKAEGLPTH